MDQFKQMHLTSQLKPVKFQLQSRQALLVLTFEFCTLILCMFYNYILSSDVKLGLHERIWFYIFPAWQQQEYLCQNLAVSQLQMSSNQLFCIRIIKLKNLLHPVGRVSQLFELLVLEAYDDFDIYYLLLVFLSLLQVVRY